MAERVLTALNLPYIPQATLGPKQTVDFLLPDHSAILEMDGPYWHNGREAYDKRRDAIALAKGLRVIHFSCAHATSGAERILKDTLQKELYL